MRLSSQPLSPVASLEFLALIVCTTINTRYLHPEEVFASLWELVAHYQEHDGTIPNHQFPVRLRFPFSSYASNPWYHGQCSLAFPRFSSMSYEDLLPQARLRKRVLRTCSDQPEMALSLCDRASRAMAT